jgi:hypothetical protein
MQTPRQLDSVSIVVKGHLNPAIFSPAWMLGQGLIGQSEYEAAAVNIISRNAASFKMGWLECHVRPDTLQLSTDQAEEFERTRDVAVGVLRALSQTPVAALGINRDVHFVVTDRDRWHAIGDTLVPKNLWDPTLRLPGMRSLTMWGARPDLHAGRIHVTVEPSQRLPQAVYVGHNDHYALAKLEKIVTSREEPWDLDPESTAEPSADKIDMVIEILSEDWAASLRRADEVVSLVARQGDQK